MTRKILIFEWLVGGGLWREHESPDADCAILSQGAGMLNALADDLFAGGLDVVVPLDARIAERPNHFGLDSMVRSKLAVTTDFKSVLQTVPIESADELPQALVDLGRQCDGVVLIAPECDGCLEDCCRWVEEGEATLLSPDRSFVNLTSNKQATCDHLTNLGIPVPIGFPLNKFRDSQQNRRTDDACTGNSYGLVFPAVIKPRLGAGSEQIQVVQSPEEIKWPADPENFRIEEFVSGQPVSVSVLCGNGQHELLPPTGQIFDGDPIGHYVDTDYPLNMGLVCRATKLARQTIEVLPPTRGYVGIDMILSSDNPTFDCVVDINPRLTMSYPILSRICDFNLGIKMLELAAGSNRFDSP